MQARQLLGDGFERVREGVHRLCDGLATPALTWRPGRHANTIAWLVWHLARIGDAQVADLADREQSWIDEGWVERFDLPFDVRDTGYGHTPEQVAHVNPDGPELLVGYVDAVIDLALAYVGTVDAEELDRIVDRSWEPPVTVGVRLVSIVNDQTQHVGQAAYVRGLYERA